MLGEKSMESTEPQNMEQEKGMISRRKLLASLGMAGVALASSGLINGTSMKAYADPADNRSKVKDLMKMDSVETTTIAGLRANTQPSAEFVYFVKDTGMEGLFKYDPSDTVSADDGATVIVSANGGRFKRIVDNTFSFLWFGGKGDGVTNNAAAFKRLAKFVNARGGNCTVVFPPGVYAYTPSDTGDYEWRMSVEFVNVKRLTIMGYGAVIKQVKNPSWTAGGLPANQEGPMQFRGGNDTPGECCDIAVYGLTMEGARVPYSQATGDGACCGLIFRGVYRIVVKDVVCTGWGTDGLLIIASYVDYYGSQQALIEGCRMDNNTRQGISIARCDDVTITQCKITNTNGGSFGHGIDFETDTHSQRNMIVSNCQFQNNERGSLNFIRTSHVVISGCVMEEGNTNGAIYADGVASDIIIESNVITTNRACLFLMGNDLTNFIFQNNIVKTTDLPFNSATVRINPFGVAKRLDNIILRHNEFSGTGGLYVDMEGRFFFEHNTMSVSRQDSASADCFGFNLVGLGINTVRHNVITIQSDVQFAEKEVYMIDGVFEGNELTSHAAAILNIKSKGAGRVMRIGHNHFSTNFYYKGEHVSLNLYAEGAVVEYVAGDFATVYRRVNGGRQRVLNGTDAQVGDITFVGDNGKPSISYICVTAGSPGVWQSYSHVVQKGTSFARPLMYAFDAGVMYLDTMLDPGGKPIWWNGSEWIDATGTVV
ncbi:right-handed parallel beta-helix repeat-containing protein [Cohnella soli]|uniref:Right-handed parallel beta-helix repeat-containing protein n=1 Tax=Cohnella soli TaxID=425005 RepID=A0ABW0I530_9BACL